MDGLYEETFVCGLYGGGAERFEEVKGSAYGSIFMSVLEDSKTYADGLLFLVDLVYYVYRSFINGWFDPHRLADMCCRLVSKCQLYRNVCGGVLLTGFRS